MALANVDRRRPRTKSGLRARKKRRPVVDVRVMARRKATLHFREVVFLVLVDEDVAARCEEQPGTSSPARAIFDGW